MSLGLHREQLDRLRLRYQVARESYKRDRKDRTRTKAEYEATVEARTILQGIAQQVQERAHKNIATIVSQCLSAVFQDPYEFQIKFEQKRGKTEAVLTFLRDGHEINPIKSSGGGVVDLASFALRLSCVLLAKPRLRKVLILDEPFKMLSVEYIPRVRTMLDRLAEELGVQFIIVTHIEGLRGSSTLRLTKKGIEDDGKPAREIHQTEGHPQ